MPIETPRPDGSLGPLYLIGALRRIGVEADLLDATVGTEDDALENTFFRNEPQGNGLTRIGMSRDRIRDVLIRNRYDIVAIHSNFTPQTRMALDVARLVKEADPHAIVIAGGVNARGLCDRFIRSGVVDVICVTEGEQVIARLAQSFRDGQPFAGIPGTVVVREGRGHTFPVTPEMISTDLDELPLPAWDKLPLAKYEQIASPHGVDLSGARHRYAPIMTSRGCPFRCLYCHISTEKSGTESLTGEIGALRMKSVGRVFDEISILRSLGVTKLFIEDDSLLAKKSRVKQIFSGIMDMGLKVADVNGVNLVHLYRNRVGGRLEPDEEYMELLKAAGFDQIVFPVESGSQRVLDKYATAKLRLVQMDVIDLVQKASRLGIVCPINMMIGFPDETEDEMMRSVDLARRLADAGAPYVTFFIPIPFPASALYEIAIREGYLNPDFDPDVMNWKNGVMQNTRVSRERIVELRDWAWRTVNPPEHVAKRLRESVGARWEPQ
jgi:radical SAM superfamily enzyme YgiQ (UPF0313 family)